MLEPDLQVRFQSLVDAHYDMLWDYASRLLRDAPEVEDLVHQAFLIAFDRMVDAAWDVADPAAWLRGTIRNLARAWWRERKRMPLALFDAICALVDGRTRVESGPLESARSALRDCLERLSPSARRFVHQRYELGMPISEIAAQESLADSSARVRLFRIRDRLKDCVRAALAGGAS